MPKDKQSRVAYAAGMERQYRLNQGAEFSISERFCPQDIPRRDGADFRP
jgi:hypothetical protein